MTPPDLLAIWILGGMLLAVGLRLIPSGGSRG